MIGATVAGRSDGLLDDLVGFFVNTLVLRLRLGEDQTLAETVRQVRDVDLAAMSNQEYPFDRVVDLVNPERTTAHHPLVQVMLAFQVEQPEPPQMPGLDTSLHLLDIKTAKFDLAFELTECFDDASLAAGISGHLEFATDLFERSTARHLAGDLVRLLEMFVTCLRGNL